MSKTIETRYYKDLLNDEFGPKLKKVKSITGNYKYYRGGFFTRIFDFISYRIILTPIAFFHTVFIRRIKIENKKILKGYKKTGFIIYANHTHAVSDAFAPTTLLFPRSVSVITNASNVSLPFIRGLTKSWGALPLPEDYLSSKNFIKETKRRLTKKGVLIIYPEAHLWDYCTFIRPFTSASFSYPLTFKCPVFSLTTTYQKSSRGKLKTVYYLDGPFATETEGSVKEQALGLRNQVYEAMVKRSEMSTFVKIAYEEEVV